MGRKKLRLHDYYDLVKRLAFDLVSYDQGMVWYLGNGSETRICLVLKKHAISHYAIY